MKEHATPWLTTPDAAFYEEGIHNLRHSMGNAWKTTDVIDLIFFAVLVLFFIQTYLSNLPRI